VIVRRAHHSVSTMTYLLNVLVLIIYDESSPSTDE
jgi:hypothetical protein